MNAVVMWFKDKLVPWIKTWWLVILIGGLIVFIWGITPRIINNIPKASADDIAVKGLFGDQFGAVTSLFSGLAFFGVLIAIRLQAKELKDNRDEMAQQRKLQASQIETMKVSAKLDSLPSLIELEARRYVLKHEYCCGTGSEKIMADEISSIVYEDLEKFDKRISLQSEIITILEDCIRRATGRDIKYQRELKDGESDKSTYVHLPGKSKYKCTVDGMFADRTKHRLIKKDLERLRAFKKDFLDCYDYLSNSDDVI